MNLAEIENSLQQLMLNYQSDSLIQNDFIFDFALAYGFPRAAVSRARLKSTDHHANLFEIDSDVIFPRKIHFKHVKNKDVHDAIDDIKKNLKKSPPRFIIATDFNTFLAYDTKTTESLDIPFNRLVKHFDFFLPLAGMEKAQHHSENPADVKAAEKMAKLYDEIRKDNVIETKEQVHSLNVFLSRLLFCFFAEDTGIFKTDLFTHSITSHTQPDGSDLNSYLDKLFKVMNTPNSQRNGLPNYLLEFPYVNGGLFKDFHASPIFTTKSRKAVIDSGALDWSTINPDIFGSMIQSVVTPEHRGNLGMHYTSVPNIMKVIEPLFLTELKEAFEAANGNKAKLQALLYRLEKIKIFDPACGSGNFLIIAYKELRHLEMQILKQLGGALTGYSVISLNNFYGIEIDDFAHEIAILSLWLAEHQMNQAFEKELGMLPPTLPLKQAGNIVHANACRIDWEAVCPKNQDDEIYVLGNPPYLGARLQSADQKFDMAFVFKGLKGFNNLDYIACWFLKGAHFIGETKTQVAFVTTNSICQGEQVSLLWPSLLKDNLEIGFAHPSFKWSNNAKANAGVIVSVIGIRYKSKKERSIIKRGVKQKAENINCYLIDAKNTFVQKRSFPLSEIPEMCFGSMANDGGHLFLNEMEKERILSDYPEAKVFIKNLVGALEFIRGINKYCLWIEDQNLDFAMQIRPIAERVERCRRSRVSSKRGVTNQLSDFPHRFAEVRFKSTGAVIVPSVSSEKREYIPMGYLTVNSIIVAPNFSVFDAKIFLLSVLTSKMHMTWVRAVAGRLKSDYRYSSSLCYNTFPFPSISKSQEAELTECTYRILDAREMHSEKTLAQLYDPEKMPANLREAHRLNDLAVERCYRSKPFESDEERLEYLFKLYEKMIAEEQVKQTSKQSKNTRKKAGNIQDVEVSDD